MSLHREMARRWRSTKITKTTRDSSTYSSNSSGFVPGFNEGYYNTSSNNAYLVIANGFVIDGDMFGARTFSGYGVKEFVKMREELLLRQLNTVELLQLGACFWDHRNF